MRPAHPSSFDLFVPGSWIKQNASGFEQEFLMMLTLVEGEFRRAVASCFAYAPIRASLAGPSRSSRHVNALRSIYAREFVLSLDSISKILDVIAKTPDCPKRVRSIVDRYKARFETLKHIRDSFAHIEDRGRGLSKGGHPLPSNLVVIESFINDDFVFTGSDGISHRVNVSPDELRTAQELVQDIFNEFEWEGPRTEVQDGSA